MKKLILLLLLLLLCFSLIGETLTPEKSYSLISENKTGSYLGLERPGEYPVVFSEEFISRKESVEFALTMTPDGKEIYFTRRKEGTFDNRIFVTREVNGHWNEPVVAGFTRNAWANEPSITPDGKKLYFGSKLSPDGSTTERKNAAIWVAERQGNRFGPAIHFEDGLMYVSVSRSGTMFVTDKSGNWPLIVKKNFIEGRYGKSEQVIGPNRQFYAAWHPYIAPDESYIIFEQIGRKNNTHGADDLFISFKDRHGKWTPVKNMGTTINSKATEFCPYVSPDGKYLFFTRYTSEKNSDIYWVDAAIIDRMRHETLKKEGSDR